MKYMLNSVTCQDTCELICFNETCSSGRPAVLRGHYMQFIFPRCFHVCHAYRHHWLLPFCTTFTDLDLARGSQCQRKATPLGFILSHAFQLIKMKSNIVFRQFKLNILILFWDETEWSRGNNCILNSSESKKNFNVGLHSDVCRPIWFKFRMAIETITLYSSTSFWMTLI